jgi:predicted transcriptional regulator
MKLKELAEWYVLIGLSGGFCFFVITVSCMFCNIMSCIQRACALCQRLLVEKGRQ